MKLTTGWWKSAGTAARYKVVYIGDGGALGHDDIGRVHCWGLSGKSMLDNSGALDLISPWAEPKEGSYEWANSLPVGTKVRWRKWGKGLFITKTEDGWSKSFDHIAIPGQLANERSGWEICKEPKFRPWETVEVPVGAVLRHKEIPGVKYLILSASEGELLFARIDKGAEGCLVRRLKLDVVSELYEHAFVGSDKWLPCGVLEEAK